MAKTTKGPKVTVNFRIELEVGKEFHGLTMEEALEEAKALNVVDLIDLNDLEHNDSNIRPIGVWEHTFIT